MKTTLCCLGNSLTPYNADNVVARLRTPTNGNKAVEQSDRTEQTGNEEEVNGLDNNPQLLKGYYSL